MAASFVVATMMAALFYCVVFVIGLSNIGGIGPNMDMVLHASLWMSIVIVFVMAISPGDDRMPSCFASSRDGSGPGFAWQALASF